MRLKLTGKVIEHVLNIIGDSGGTVVMLNADTGDWLRLRFYEFKFDLETETANVTVKMEQLVNTPVEDLKAQAVAK